jgi:hypothetical protein
MPAGGEPNREWSAGSIKDGACDYGCPPSAACTLESAVTKPPPPWEATGRADKASGPPQPFQVVQAVSVGLEPGLEIAKGFRVVEANARTVHGGILRPAPVKWIARMAIIENATAADRRGGRRLLNPNAVEGHGVGLLSLPPKAAAVFSIPLGIQILLL